MSDSVLKKPNYMPKSIDTFDFANEIKVIFTDIDGTLMPLEDNYQAAGTPKSILTANEFLVSKNIPLVLVTGRTLSEVKMLASEIGNNKTHYILLHGAEIYNPNLQIIHNDYISSKELKHLAKHIDAFCAENNCSSNFYFVFEGKQYSTRPFKIPYNGKNTIVVESLDSFGEEYFVGKLLISEENIEVRVKLQEFLSKKFPQLHVELAGAYYCDITNKTANKGNAVKRLAELMNIDLKNAAVFGDAQNDKCMFDVVNSYGGLTIAVENAVDDLKIRAKYITKSVYNDGFLYAVERIFEHNKLFVQEKIPNLH